MGCSTFTKAPSNYDVIVQVSGGPAYVTYTNDMPDGWRGYQTKNRVYLRPEQRGNPATLAHELEHVRQYYNHPFMSKFNRELLAYREEIKAKPKAEQEEYAAWVADRMRGPIYKFKVDREKLIRLLLAK